MSTAACIPQSSFNTCSGNAKVPIHRVPDLQTARIRSDVSLASLTGPLTIVLPLEMHAIPPTTTPQGLRLQTSAFMALHQVSQAKRQHLSNPHAYRRQLAILTPSPRLYFLKLRSPLRPSNNSTMTKRAYYIYQAQHCANPPHPTEISTHSPKSDVKKRQQRI